MKPDDVPRVNGQPVYWFGRFELRASERKLLRLGAVVDIGDRAFDVLVALVVHRGQVLTKSQLLDLVWPDVVVEESNVQVQVSALRKCLGPDVIATIQGRGYRFTAPVEGAAPDSTESADLAAGNLPAGRSPLVGRDEELGSLCAMVEAHSLVTVTGSGGMGKTALSLAAADQLSGSFRDGAWVVELAPLSDSTLLSQAVAHSLRLTLRGEGAPAEQLVNALATRSLLLLDNCEHLLAAAAGLVDALRAHAPGVHVLATSQELLNLPGERVFPLGPLSVPAPGESPHGKIHSAVALLVERAQAMDPRFELNEDNAGAVADICRQLDGLPLAIELAAARLHAIGPSALGKKLGERFKVLTRGAQNAAEKHQTLYAAVDWSHELLEPDERALFRRLAVFVGGFDLDACEAVCRVVGPARLDVLERLPRLVDKSLVIAEPAPHGMVRYRLLETIRHYARDKLQAAGEARIMAEAHLRHYTAVAEEAYEGRFGADAEWLDLLERELDNLRAALEWAAENDRDAELCLAGALGWFWSLHTVHAAEGRMRLARALGGRDEEQTAAVARTLTGAALTLTWAGAPVEAAALAERSVAIWELLGDDREAGLANEALGWARFTAGDTAGALPPMERSAFFMRRLGDRRLMNRALIGQAQVLVALAEVEATERLAHEVLNTARELGILRDIHYALHFLGDCGLWRGDGVDAAKWYRQSLPAALAYGNVAEAAVELVVLAMALGAQGRAESAVRLFGAASAKLDEVHFDISGIEMARIFIERFIAPARAELGAQASVVEADGRSLSWDAAVAEALDLSASPALF